VLEGAVLQYRVIHVVFVDSLPRGETLRATGHGGGLRSANKKDKA
jgi:hypothetical protein